MAAFFLTQALITKTTAAITKNSFLRPENVDEGDVWALRAAVYAYYNGGSPILPKFRDHGDFYRD